MTKHWPRDICVLIPSYRSVDSLKRFVRELTTLVPKENICVVDDASGDGTYEFCESAGIVCLRHKTNKGKGAALRTGFAFLTKGNGDAAVNWIVTMDADGQHSLVDIYRFVKEARLHPNMGLCIGARDMRLGMMPLARILSNRLTSLILSAMTGTWVQDSQCGYRIYSRRFLNAIRIEHDRFEMESEVIIKSAAKNFDIRFARVQTLYLREGQSHISHVTDTLRWVAATLTVWLRERFVKRHL